MFLSNGSFEVSGLAACLGLGIHPIGPGLRPLPVLLDNLDRMEVELPSPGEDQARQVIVAHLDHYRLDRLDDGTIKPFTEDGINALLKNRHNPRHLLTNAAKVVQHAMQEGAASINEATVNAAMDAPAPLMGSDITEGIEGAL